MSAPLQNISTERWQLAQHLFDTTPLPKDTLENLFKTILYPLELIADIPFDTELKQKVWNSSYKDRLEELNKTYISEICNKILKNFSDDETKIMLKEYSESGNIKSTSQNIQVKLNIDVYEDSINIAVNLKALSMIDEWVKIIVKDLEKEGVSLRTRSIDVKH